MGKTKKFTVDEGRTQAKSQRRQNRLARRAMVRRLKRENGGRRVKLDFQLRNA